MKTVLKTDNQSSVPNDLNTMVITPSMEYDHSIAKYIINNKDIGERELFFVPENTTDKAYGKGDYVVLAGRSNDGVHLWIYTDLKNDFLNEYSSKHLDDDNIPFTMPKDPVDILTYPNDDVIFIGS